MLEHEPLQKNIFLKYLFDNSEKWTLDKIKVDIFLKIKAIDEMINDFLCERVRQLNIHLLQYLTTFHKYSCIFSEN